MILIILAAGCSSSIETKDYGIDKNVNEIVIKTSKIEVAEEPEYERPSPSLRIIFPEEGQLIKNSTVAVKLEAYNFSIVPIEKPVKEYQGHFHVWIDSEKKIVMEDSEIFENIGNGGHTLTAELVKGNHSSLSPKIFKTISFYVDVPVAKKDAPQPFSSGYWREYSIEADDNGFYPNKIRAGIGDNVTIYFKFRDFLIYYAGLDLIGPFPDVNYRTGNKQPINRSFIMREEIVIKSFWPSSGVKKAEMIVEVEK
ncbi:hypothetical protein HY637_03865 [Candidatus Woesearchaeota archaeon]|nr:hypothetical protein [Candidatus Woesearchaeota archaeon]